jgi:predicted transposase YdaD
MGLIGREHMKESKAFDEIMEFGRAEGQRTGLLEGRQEGWRDARRADIHEALRLRFGDVKANEFTRPLNSVEDAALLSRLYQREVSCSPADEFRRALLKR